MTAVQIQEVRPRLFVGETHRVRVEDLDFRATQLVGGRNNRRVGGVQFVAMYDVFGSEFIAIYAGVKRGEFETFMEVISPWEREYLLLNV